VTAKNAVFWDVVPCKSCVNRGFGGTHRLHLQGRKKPRTRNQREQVQTAATCSRWFLSRGFFYPEDEGDAFFRNVGLHKTYTAPHPRRRHSSQTYISPQPKNGKWRLSAYGIYTDWSDERVSFYTGASRIALVRTIPTLFSQDSMILWKFKHTDLPCYSLYACNVEWNGKLFLSSEKKLIWKDMTLVYPTIQSSP
jgi:hypothetical protein